MGVITAGTRRKKWQDKVVGGLHGRGMHTFLLSMESCHSPSWTSVSHGTSELMGYRGKNANGLTGTL